MLPPYLIKQLRLRRVLCAAAILAGVVFSFTLNLLRYSRLQMRDRIQEVYDNLEVRCAVTNLTGTQSDYLDLPEWVIRLFLTGATGPNKEPEEVNFSSYIRDVQIRTRLSAESPHGSVTLCGITDPASEAALSASSGSQIVWREGFDASVFQGDDNLCLVPADMEEEDEIFLRISRGGVQTDTEVIEVELQVAGTYTGGGTSIYGPWQYVAALYEDAYGYLRADSISAVIRDNRKIDEFWELCDYFVAPTKDGAPVEWTASPVYRYYPYALSIYDDTLKETVLRLERNQHILAAVSWLLIALSFTVGAVYSFLNLQKRKMELKQQYMLGLRLAGILLGTVLEQGLLCLIGVALGTAAFVLAFRSSPDGLALLGFWCVNILATALAFAMTMRRSFLEANLEVE